MYGEDALVRQDAARAKRNGDRRERRNAREESALTELHGDGTFVCASCSETLEQVERVPGTEQCFACDLSGSADATLADVGPENVRTTWGLVAVQVVLAVSVLGIYALLVTTRPDQAFALHSFAMMPALFASVLGVAHAVRSPTRAHGHAVFHGLSAVLWVALWALVLVAGGR
jgi:hypothetical protein